MSSIIIRRTESKTTALQKKFDEKIQNILNYYQYFDERKEFKDNTGKDEDLIISHKSTIPDMVIYNKGFNKNLCFFEGNDKEKNTFPREKFYIRFKDTDKEQSQKYSYNKKKKKDEKKKNTKCIELDEKAINNNNNFINKDNKKDNKEKEKKEKEETEKKRENEKEEKKEDINKNLEKKNKEISDNENNNNNKEKFLDKHEDEGNDNSADENEQNEEEGEDENNEAKDSKEFSEGNKTDEDKVKEEDNNNEQKIINNNNQINYMKQNTNQSLNLDKSESMSINSYTLQKDFFIQKNNINNNNYTNYINNNNNNNFLNPNINNDNNFAARNINNNDSSSLLDDLSMKNGGFSGSGILNMNYNIIDKSQSDDESFISQNSNKINFLKTNNFNNTNFSEKDQHLVNNDINLQLFQNIMLNQQSNNQFNQININNNNMLGILGKYQNILNNYNFVNNNVNSINLNNPQNQLLLQSTYDYMHNKGWIVFNKVGNQVNDFTSLELFKFLTENILSNNIKLDDYIISVNNMKFSGGLIYMSLLNILPVVFDFMEQQIKQDEINKRILGNNNFNNNVVGNNLFANTNNSNNNINLIK